MAVESLLRYRFKQKKLLEETLTHPSCTESVSYQRLEFVGDAARPRPGPHKLRFPQVPRQVLSPTLRQHQHRQARARRRPPPLIRVREFVVAVKEEQAIEIYGD